MATRPQRHRRDDGVRRAERAGVRPGACAQDLAAGSRRRSQGSRNVRPAGRRFGTRAWLVVGQIALSLMLMTAGGLFARGALKAGASDPGYRYEGLLLASIDSILAG